MRDARLEKLAALLVNYCISVQSGEWIAIMATDASLPLVRYVHAEIIKAGGYPSVIFTDDTMTRTLIQHGNDHQLNWVDPTLNLFAEKADAFIALGGSSNTRAMTHVDAVRTQQYYVTRKKWLKKFYDRTDRGENRWVLTQYPTEAAAQEANMSLEEYEDFLFSAVAVNQDDPVAYWQKMRDVQQSKVDYLKGKKHVVLKGPNTDLSLSIEGRVFLNDDGKMNMPGGEIYTGPVEDSVNGWVRFTYPSIVSGRAVSGIELKFENGKVVQASAEQNDDLLQAQLNTDAGARYLGEFAIGTNYNIDRFSGSILFDEKIGGTVHMAIGESYAPTGGKNNSAVHWDMICDMRTDSTIHVDGELFYKDGQFVE